MPPRQSHGSSKARLKAKPWRHGALVAPLLLLLLFSSALAPWAGLEPDPQIPSLETLAEGDAQEGPTEENSEGSPHPFGGLALESTPHSTPSPYAGNDHFVATPRAHQRHPRAPPILS